MAELSRVWIVGEVPASIVPASQTGAAALADRRGLIDDAGRLLVEPLLQRLCGTRSLPVLVLASADLFIPECGSLIGYASRDRGVVVVSTARLADADDDAVTARRVANVAAHELGHLQGLKHCSTAGCLMRPAQTAMEIDQRAPRSCGACPRLASRRASMATAAAVLLGAVVGADYVASQFAPTPEFPFICITVNANGQELRDGEGPEDRVVFRIRDRELFIMRDAGGSASLKSRSRPATFAINDLWREDVPVAFRVTATRAGARITANDVVIADVLPLDTVGRLALETGRAWAAELADAFRATGRSAEVAP